jgi:hypothetical protein
MTADWDIDEAVDETLDAMEAGAGLLKIGPDLRKALRNLYYPDFKTQHDKGVPWYGVNQTKVLTLATMGGMTAAGMTVMKAPNPFPLPGEIDKASAFQAAYWVAHCMYCTAGKGFKLLGGFCQTARDLEGSNRDPYVLRKLAKVFAKPIRDLMEGER